MSNDGSFPFRRNTFLENLVASTLIFALAVLLLPWSTPSFFYQKTDELCQKLVNFLPITDRQSKNSVSQTSSEKIQQEPSKYSSKSDPQFNNLNVRNSGKNFSNHIFFYTILLVTILAFIAMLGNTIWDLCKSCLQKIHFRVRKDLELVKCGILEPLSWNTKKVFIRKAKDTGDLPRIKLDPACISLIAGETGSGKHYKIFSRCQEHRVSPFVNFYIMILFMFALFLLTGSCLMAVSFAGLIGIVGVWSQYEFNFLDRLGWIRVYEFHGELDDVHQLTNLKDKSLIIDICKKIIYWVSGRKNNFWLVILPMLLIGVLWLKGLSAFSLTLIAFFYWLFITIFVKQAQWYLCVGPLLFLGGAEMMKIPFIYSFSASAIFFIIVNSLTERDSWHTFWKGLDKKYLKEKIYNLQQSWSRRRKKVLQFLKTPAVEVLIDCKDFFFKSVCATLIRLAILIFLTVGSLLAILIAYIHVHPIPSVKAQDILSSLQLDNPLYFLALTTCCIGGIVYFTWLCLLRRIIIITREDTQFQLNHFARAIVDVYCQKSHRDMIVICYNYYRSPKYRDDLIHEIQKQLNLREEKDASKRIQSLDFPKLHAHELRDFLYQKLREEKVKPAIQEMQRLTIERTDDYTLQLICGEGRQLKFLDKIYEDLVDHSLYEIKRYSRLNSQCHDLLQEVSQELLKMDHAINLNEYLGISAALLLAIQFQQETKSKKNLITQKLFRKICAEVGLLSIEADNIIEILSRREILLPYAHSGTSRRKMLQKYDISDQVKQYNAFHARLQVSCGDLRLEANCYYQFSMVFEKTIKILIEKEYDLTDGLINVIRHFPFELKERPEYALAINPVRLYRLILKYYPKHPSALNLRRFFSCWADALMESYDFERKSTLLETCTDILILSEKLSNDDYLIVVSELVPTLAMLEEAPKRWKINEEKISLARDNELKILLNCYREISYLSARNFKKEKYLLKRIKRLQKSRKPVTLCEKMVLEIINIQIKEYEYKHLLSVPSCATQKLKNVSNVQGIKFICFLLLRLRPLDIKLRFNRKQYKQLLEKINIINAKAFSRQLIHCGPVKLGTEYLCLAYDHLAGLISDMEKKTSSLTTQKASILFWLNMACVRLLAESKQLLLKERWKQVLLWNEEHSKLPHEYPSMNPFFARESCRLAQRLLIKYWKNNNDCELGLLDEIKQHYKQWIFAFNNTTSVVLPYVGILLCHSGHLDIHYRTRLWEKLRDAFIDFCHYESSLDGKSVFLRPGYLYIQFFKTNQIMLHELRRWINNFSTLATWEKLKKEKKHLDKFLTSTSTSAGIMDEAALLIERDFCFTYDEKIDNTKELFLNAVCAECLIMYALKLEKSNPRLKKNTLIFKKLQKRYRKTERILRKRK